MSLEGIACRPAIATITIPSGFSPLDKKLGGGFGKGKGALILGPTGCPFKLRVEGRKRLLMVDEEGYQRLMEFHYWCLEQLQGSTTDMAPFFLSWRNHCLRLALIRTAMEGGAANKVIPSEYVNEAAEFLMRLARSQFTLLERMISGNPEEEKWARVEQLVGKLQVRGPMTRRSIVRCFNDQDYRTIDALIAMGVADGRIEQRGAFFVSKSVSVSASAA